MHFRFRGNNIQVIKSLPDPATGKAKSVPLGSINRATLGISEKLRANCTAGELQEIEAWVRRYQGVDEIRRKHAALTLPEQIATAIRWFRDARQEEARGVAEDILTATTKLRRTLSRRGLI